MISVDNIITKDILQNYLYITNNNNSNITTLSKNNVPGPKSGILKLLYIFYLFVKIPKK